MTKRVIFHIDMNSYFASCEQQANPHLRGRPIGVCEHLGGIIIAPSVEAKRCGVKTAMSVREARKYCPHIILLPVDPPKYREITRKFLRIFSEYTDLVERYSIDEAFLDVTEAINVKPAIIANSEFGLHSVHQQAGHQSYWDDKQVWNNALFLALEIKSRIRKEVGEWLTCSVGVAENKLLAKIASDMDKPDGVTVIKPEDVPGLYDRLSLTDVPGIGNCLARRLNLLGIVSLRDLAVYPESLLRSCFGILGHNLIEMGKLRCGGKLLTPDKEEIKSLGHAYTLPRATVDLTTVKKLLFALSEKVAVRLRRRNLWCSRVTCLCGFAATPDIFTASAGVTRGELKLSLSRRDADLSIGKSRRMRDFTNDGKVIFKQVWKLFQSYHSHLAVRMAGVTVAGLAANVLDEPLFVRYKKFQQALIAQDCINGKYGDFTLRPATLVDAQNFIPDTVGFGRIKEMPS